MFRDANIGCIYAAGAWSESLTIFKQQNPDIIFVTDWRDIDKHLPYKHDGFIIVLDDMMSEFEDSAEAGRYLKDLYTKRSHHENLTIFTTIQFAFPKKFRTISLNSNILVFFPNSRDKTYINHINRQYCPDFPR